MHFLVTKPRKWVKEVMEVSTVAGFFYVPAWVPG